MSVKKEQVVVFLHAAGVPGQDEDDEGDEHAAHFNEGVEEQVAVEARGVEARDEHQAGNGREDLWQACALFVAPVHKGLKSQVKD